MYTALAVLAVAVVFPTGISNSAGAWITPGFQLHLSKVDQVPPRPPAALAGMRFPVALSQHRQPPPEQHGEPVVQQEEQLQERQPADDFMPDVTEQ